MRSWWGAAAAAVLIWAGSANAAPFSSKVTTVMPFSFSVDGLDDETDRGFDVIRISFHNGPSDLGVTIRCAVRSGRGEQWTGDGKFTFAPGEKRSVRLPVERPKDVQMPTSASCIVVQFDAPGLQPD